MSQLGTRISGWLGDDDDIHAVLSGLAGREALRGMLARLQPGMTRAQVRFTLGTPLVVDPFRADRWDYVYVYMKQGVVTEQRRIVVVFKDDKLARVEGDVVPAGAGKAGTDKPAPSAGGAQSAHQAER